MAKKTNKPLEDSHDRPPMDEQTKNKIDKHLRDESDTISEDDIKNINTNTGAGTPSPHQHDIDEADEIIKEDINDGEDPEKEAPSSWEILGE